MSSLRRQILLNLLKLSDLAIMLGAFLLSTFYVVRANGTFTLSDFLAMRVKVGNFLLFIALLVLWHIMFSVFGLYNSRRMFGRAADAIDTFMASTAGMLLIGMAALIFPIRMVSPGFLVVFGTTATTAAIGQRFLLRAVLERIRLRGRNLRSMLIVGTNLRALEFTAKIEARPEFGYRVIGFVDGEWAGLQNFSRSGYPIVADFNDLPNFLRRNVVDEVVIALPMASLHAQAARIAALCEEQGIITRILSNIFDLKLARPQAELFEGASLITNHIGVVEGWPNLAKRAVDIVISAILLVGFAPLLLMIAALIKFTSSGPVLFVQNRLGFNKRRFTIYKFRTMVEDAERRIKEVEHLNEVPGPVFKIKNDPRMTPVGRFLRKTSIDEFPQLFNVLRGDMSLVGPRPLPVRDYEGFSQDWQRRRFSVRPGITCLWQIHGRSSVPFDKWMELDLQYIDKWSFWLDVEILIRTIPAVLRGSGAA
jgi:exopolysaccharide biosynthesis polyprenyl glycosylphosphotransferase